MNLIVTIEIDLLVGQMVQNQKETCIIIVAHDWTQQEIWLTLESMVTDSISVLSILHAVILLPVLVPQAHSTTNKSANDFLMFCNIILQSY